MRVASDPTLVGVNRTYFDTNGRPAAWPACAIDERNREVIWSLCERLPSAAFKPHDSTIGRGRPSAGPAG
jgi:hypothetical protein